MQMIYDNNDNNDEMPAVSNVVTNGNGTGTKRNRAFGLSLVPVFCLRGATTVANVKLFSTWTWSTVIFYSM